MRMGITESKIDWSCNFYFRFWILPIMPIITTTWWDSDLPAIFFTSTFKVWT